MAKNLLEYYGSSAIPFTPFDDNDNIDVKTLEKEIDFIVSAGSKSLCVPVMVSEFQSMSEAERELMIRVPIEVNAGRAAIIANCAALNKNRAIKYAVYAEKLGADCVIAMAPYIHRMEFKLIKDYFKGISDAISIPIMIQNASNNAMLNNQQVIEICSEIENVRYVKQELQPGPTSIASLKKEKCPAVEMISSGFGGRFSIFDYHYGATSTVHAAQFCDVIQNVWDLLFAGKEDEGYELQAKILPGIQMENLYGMVFGKEVMKRRGVLKNNRTRTNASGLPPEAMHELDILWEKIEPLFTYSI